MTTRARAWQPSQGGRTLLAVLYTAFFLTGILTALPGPLLPILLKKWLLTDAQAGSTVATQFLGTTIGSFLSNRNLRMGLLCGLALMSVGTAGLIFLEWPLLLGCVFCNGLGLGLSIPAINLTVAARGQARRAASLSLLNSVWGAGAICCPALVIAFQKLGAMQGLLAGLALAAVLLLFSLFRMFRPEQPSPFPVAALRKHPLWLFGLLFFLYVGAETTIASWILVYIQRVSPDSPLFRISPLTYFWAALVVARASSVRILGRFPYGTFYAASLVVAVAAFVLVLSSKSPLLIVLGTISCGAALAPVFPLLLTFAAEFLLSRRNSGWVFGCAGLGGAILPWVAGRLSTRYSSLRIGLLVPVFAILGLLFAGIRLIFSEPTATVPAPPAP